MIPPFFSARSRRNAELDEEIESHLRMAVQDRIARGEDPKEAEYAVRREFGNIARVKEVTREMWGSAWVDLCIQDVRYAARRLLRTPGFTTVILLTLALGIGICTSLYLVVRGVIVDPVPFPASSELLSVELARQDGPSLPLYTEFRVWEAEVAPVADLAGYALGSRHVGNERGTVEAFSIRVTDGFFPLLRARPYLGRTLVPGDIAAASEPAAVISYHLWQNFLGADPSVIGKPIHVGGRAFTLVGVLERGQEFPAPVDVWTPLVPAPEELGSLHVTVIGRLMPGATREHVSVAVEAVHQSMVLDRQPEASSTRAEILPLPGRSPEGVGVASLLLAISVGSILLIGIANAAGLIATRTLARRHEIAIRASLGASWSRIVALLITEAMLIGVAAAILGLLIAHLALEGFRRGLPEAVTRQMLGWAQVGLDGHVISFAVGLAVLAGLICGLVPALGAARPNVAPALQQNSAAVGAGPQGSRLLRAMVTGEVALSVVLLICAGFLTRSLLELVGREPGFEMDRVVTVRWSVPNGGDAEPGDLLRLHQELLGRVAGVPGVASATLASDLPATRPGFGDARAYELQDPVPARGRAAWRAVTPDYLEALRVPLLQGRAIAAFDAAEAPRVALVSESLARRHRWDAKGALGRQISAGGALWTVVGVVGDVHNSAGSTGSEETIYVPQAQAPTGSGYLVVRLAAPLASVTQALRDAIWRTDPSIAVGAVLTLEEVIDELTSDERIIASLISVYALTALVVTLISLYAIVAHLVVRHRREYAIRAALGASPHRILGNAMRRALAAALAGTLLGTVIAIGLGRIITSLLYGVRPLEPSLIGVLPILLLGVFALAIYLPARKAAKVDPMATLRT